jgi:hypothetical protein
MTLQEFETELKDKFDGILDFVENTKIDDLDEFQQTYQEELVESLYDFLVEHYLLDEDQDY